MIDEEHAVHSRSVVLRREGCQKGAFAEGAERGDWQLWRGCQLQLLTLGAKEGKCNCQRVFAGGDKDKKYFAYDECTRVRLWTQYSTSSSLNYTWNGSHIIRNECPLLNRTQTIIDRSGLSQMKYLKVDSSFSTQFYSLISGCCTQTSPTKKTPFSFLDAEKERKREERIMGSQHAGASRHNIQPCTFSLLRHDILFLCLQ